MGMGMMMRWCDRFSALFSCFAGCCFNRSLGQRWVLRGPHACGRATIFQDLLQQSPTAAGHEVKIEIPTGHPTKRLVLMLEESVLSPGLAGSES